MKISPVKNDYVTPNPPDQFVAIVAFQEAAQCLTWLAGEPAPIRFTVTYKS
ncbi:MAG: hypothetical protein M1118_02475 [Chloroflexi bacterium]|nr:hypothetical protein [Chloroflexota bacterium]